MMKRAFIGLGCLCCLFFLSLTDPLGWQIYIALSATFGAGLLAEFGAIVGTFSVMLVVFTFWASALILLFKNFYDERSH